MFMNDRIARIVGINDSTNAGYRKKSGFVRTFLQKGLTNKEKCDMIETGKHR